MEVNPAMLLIPAILFIKAGLTIAALVDVEAQGVAPNPPGGNPAAAAAAIAPAAF